MEWSRGLIVGWALSLLNLDWIAWRMHCSDFFVLHNRVHVAGKALVLKT